MEIEEAKEFVRGFIKEMNEQDNRGTATPFYYVIRSAKFVSSYYKGEGDRVTAQSKEDCETSFVGKDEDDCFKDFLSNKKDYEEYEDKTEDELRKIFKDEFCLFWECQEWDERCFFLTESEAEEHLRLNHYHYSENAHTYAKHCWRAPQLKKFFESVGVLCGEEYIRK